MLGVTSGSELFWDRRNQTEKKEMPYEFRFNYLLNENRLKISVKKSAFDLPWDYSKNKLSLLKK